MIVSLKELFFILIIAAVVFKVAKPIARLYTTEQDFSRRRNVWFALTIAAFVMPSFWLFAAIAIPVLISAGRKDSNPVALYLLLLQVIPAIPVDIPMVGLSRLFVIDNYFLLSFFVLLPAAHRLLRSKTRIGIRRLETMDVMLLAYGILTVSLFLHPESSQGVVWTQTLGSTLRRTFSFFIGAYIPYFMISRSVSSRRIAVEDLAAICLSCGVMAAIAIFESARHWLLYGDLAAHWGYNHVSNFYYTRGDFLRATASAGHPLALGFILEIGFGFWLYLQSHSTSKRVRLGVTLLLWTGLLATYSRGPWIGAVCMFFVFYLLRPRALSALLKAGVVVAIVGVLISFSPLGSKIADMLPFFGGSVDNGSVAYRHELLDRAWQIIQESPFFGDQDALLKMQDLRQGEGIIDVVNTYVNVLLSSGFVGLSLFLGFILIALFKAYAVCRRYMVTDRDFSMLGASLVSCILGTLIMMMDASFGTTLERMFYVLAGLGAGYSYLGKSLQRTSPEHALSAQPAQKVARTPYAGNSKT